MIKYLNASNKAIKVLRKNKDCYNKEVEKVSKHEAESSQIKENLVLCIAKIILNNMKVFVLYVTHTYERYCWWGCYPMYLLRVSWQILYQNGRPLLQHLSQQKLP